MLASSGGDEPCLLRADGGDEDLGVGLAVTALLRPALLLLAEVGHLLVLALADDLALHGRSGDHGATDLRLALAAQQEHVERELPAHLAVLLLDLDSVALGDAVLLAAGPDHCVHRPLLVANLLEFFGKGRLAHKRQPARTSGRAVLYDPPPAAVKDSRHFALGAMACRPRERTRHTPTDQEVERWDPRCSLPCCCPLPPPARPYPRCCPSRPWGSPPSREPETPPSILR